MFPIDVLRFSEFRTMRNHLSEILMLNDIQITSDYMSRWVVLKRRVGAVTSQRVLKVLFYVNILQCFFVVENFTANAVSVAIGDNGNRLIFEIWCPRAMLTGITFTLLHVYGFKYFKINYHQTITFCAIHPWIILLLTRDFNVKYSEQPPEVNINNLK